MQQDLKKERELTRAKLQMQQQEAALTACHLRVMEFKDKIEQEEINIMAHEKAIREYSEAYNVLLRGENNG